MPPSKRTKSIMKNPEASVTKKSKISPDSITSELVSGGTDAQTCVIPSISKSCREALKKCSDNDPAVFISFNVDNLKAGLTAINNMPPELRPANPNWLPIETTYPITAEHFKGIILHYISRVSTGGVFDNAFIAPNTTDEVVRITAKLIHLNYDRYIQEIAHQGGGYLGRFCLAKESSNMVTVSVLGIPPIDMHGITDAFV